MNFFESQDKARRNTTRLLVLFVLAVVSLIVMTNLMVMFLLGFTGTGMTSMAATQPLRVDWDVFWIVGLTVSVVVVAGSLYKISALSGGGARVAEMMDGRLLLASGASGRERILLNVVEEMAIASGTPVPPVYLMEEAGINAFAAGYSPADAVIGITRGAVDTLSRDQLQGVIAHEFSHILHGDMRINIRLLGVLYGILVLGLIGQSLLRSTRHSRRSRNTAGIAFLGLGLVIMGYVGTFFGNLIKAAVSRQREFLADASAVQFTRNPNGIAGALMQIATSSEKSYLQHPSSNEISHALFEEAGLSPLRRLYATHPPITERIAALLPNWDGSFDLSATAAQRGEKDGAMEQTGGRGTDAGGGGLASGIETGAGAGVIAGVVLAADALINKVGNPDSADLEFADAVLQQLPAPVLEAARSPSGARAVIYLLVLSRTEPTRRRQLNLLENCSDPGVYQEFLQLTRLGFEIEPQQRIPLLEISQGSLRQLSGEQYQCFRQNFNEMIALDKKISLMEWSLQKILFSQLDRVFDHKRRRRLGKADLRQQESDCALLLSVLARSNPQESITPEQAFAGGAARLQMELTMKTDLDDLSLAALDSALDRLARIKPLQKPALLKACAACIAADQRVAAIEAELIRAVAVIIDCPLPPLAPESAAVSARAGS